MITETRWYVQACMDPSDDCAAIKLESNHEFEFADYRNESCWVWYGVTGKWQLKNDSLILYPNKERKDWIRFRNPTFLVRGDSLLFHNPNEIDKHINWGNFRLALYDYEKEGW